MKKNIIKLMAIIGTVVVARELFNRVLELGFRDIDISEDYE